MISSTKSRVARVAQVAAALLATLLTFTAGAAFAAAAWTPPDNTITRVTGARHSGFHVRYHDKATDHLPTLSEARTECAAYRDRVERVRCRVEVRVHYRALGQTKRAIWYARR